METTAPLLDLPDVSLVCVETRRPQLALYALRRCLQQARFGEVRLLGSQPCGLPLPPQVQEMRIRALNGIEDYSRFMLRELGDHFSLGHVLVVQWDGFITDATRWEPAFLNYDYVGAPWPGPPAVVGNGGFSLRSRRLVDALQQMQTPQVHPEDERICVTYRSELENAHGLRFAPVDLAARFSWERPEPPLSVSTFGCHGFFNFHRMLDEDELLSYFDECDPALLYSVEARRLLKNLYRSGLLRAADKLHGLRCAGSARLRLDAFKLRGFARLRALTRKNA